MQQRNWKVWHKQKKEWLKYLVMLPSGRVGDIAEDGSVVCLRDADVDVVFQTGLRDKNAKEIYEGDILSWGGEGIAKLNVAVKSHLATFGFRHYGSFLGLNMFAGGGETNLEVIGNVFENPDLVANSNEPSRG